ncbi:cupin domain-containing protein [Streptomyces rhizosphaericus]|uniref:hypothetical protein n=1 Tax=Streptomyces rhizosphaericus TaxID=114699 RepID=UPI003643E375
MQSEEQRERLAELKALAEARINGVPVDDSVMSEALAAGAAVPLGDFPDAPVRYRDTWWVRAGAAWRAGDEQVQRLFDEDAARYRMAVAARDAARGGGVSSQESIGELLHFLAGVTLEKLPRAVCEGEGEEAVAARIEVPPGCVGWAVRWPPGAEADWHHHPESGGALVVLAGELQEQWRDAEPDLFGTQAVPGRNGSWRLGAGERRGIPAGSVHRVANPVAAGGAPALSVHVALLPHATPCHGWLPGCSSGSQDDSSRSMD